MAIYKVMKSSALGDIGDNSKNYEHMLETALNTMSARGFDLVGIESGNDAESRFIFKNPTMDGSHQIY